CFWFDMIWPPITFGRSFDQSIGWLALSYALVAIGGMIDLWIDKACRPLLLDMRIKYGTPLSVVLHFVAADHMSHGVSPRASRSQFAGNFLEGSGFTAGP